MSKEDFIRQLELEIKAIDEVNKELINDIRKIELSIKKKELILKKLELEKIV